MVRLSRKDKVEFIKEQDPYNPQNYLDGWINRREYGKLIINSINGEYCFQEIQTTPKLHYPMDKKNTFYFPKNINMVESFEKLDGTNILQYVYTDHNNKSYISFKTRLTMFPNQEFRILLNKALKKYKNINQLPFINHCNLSYELWGYLNPITIAYDKPIQLTLLFGIKKNGTIISPTHLDSKSIPKANLNKTILITNKEKKIKESYTKAIKEYLKMEELVRIYYLERQKLEKSLIPIGEPTILKDNKDIPIRKSNGEKVEVYSSYKGIEGSIWYCHLDHYIQMYKLKPPTIETIHQLGSASGSRMSRIAIKNTLINATEDLYILDLDNVLPYLEEEYSEKEIEFFSDYIKEQIKEINEQKKFEREIIKLYQECNLDINEDRGETMRYYAEIYGSNKYNITRVFNVLKKYFME